MRNTKNALTLLGLRRYHDVCAEVAQLVEHSTENAGVGSSILPLGTIPLLFSTLDLKTNPSNSSD